MSWNFAYDFLLLYYRSSSIVVNLRQFLWELCPFWNLEYRKYAVFRTFLLHSLTYWAEILYITLLCCTSIQVWVLSIYVSFCGSYAPFGTWNTGNTVFHTFLWHALTYWAEILHKTMLYCTTDQVPVSLINVNFCRSYAPFGTSNIGNKQFSALFSYIFMPPAWKVRRGHLEFGSLSVSPSVHPSVIPSRL